MAFGNQQTGYVGYIDISSRFSTPGLFSFDSYDLEWVRDAWRWPISVMTMDVSFIRTHTNGEYPEED
jgi:hypothetical protein